MFSNTCQLLDTCGLVRNELLYVDPSRDPYGLFEYLPLRGRFSDYATCRVHGCLASDTEPRS